MSVERNKQHEMVQSIAYLSLVQGLRVILPSSLLLGTETSLSAEFGLRFFGPQHRMILMLTYRLFVDGNLLHQGTRTSI